MTELTRAEAQSLWEQKYLVAGTCHIQSNELTVCAMAEPKDIADWPNESFYVVNPNDNFASLDIAIRNDFKYYQPLVIHI